MVIIDETINAFGSIAELGGPTAVLLAGSGATRLDLTSQRAVAGDPVLHGSALHEAIAGVDLKGRGGAAFSLRRKLDAVIDSGGRPTVIVNVSESEPASAKDRTLVLMRPHLVLDGAALVASILGASMVTLAFHANERGVRRSLEQAIHERSRGGLVDPAWALNPGPSGYVRGEAGAVADRVAGGSGLPLHRTVPLARRGPSGLPTLVSNAETMAQVAALSIHGIVTFEAVGTSACSGTRLMTVTGDGEAPGRVFEVVGSVTFGDLLRQAGHHETPPYVLLGGFAGTWVSGDALVDCEVSDHSLGTIGAGLGCGLVGVVGEGQCPVDELARLTRYLASESAGQCGPCVRGLPSVAALVEKLSRSGRAGSARRIGQLADEIVGRGACSHPDATMAMVASALTVMAPEIDHHRHGSCAQVGAARPVFPIPSGPAGRSSWGG